MRLKYAAVLITILLTVFLHGCEGVFRKKPVVIIYPKDASPIEILASREIQRYIFVRTGAFLEIVKEGEKKISKNRNRILVADKMSSLIVPETKSENMDLLMSLIDDDHYLLKTITKGKRKTLLITGGTDLGVLYGAYTFAESLGVSFNLHRDIIPEKKIQYKFPEISVDAKPLFEIRGIQPFHDFPEGPDWWNLDEYRAIIAQLPKLGMNFIGLHTYPEGGVGPEPAVWIGLKDDINPDGTVKYSYPSRWFTSLEGGWGYQSRNTSDYLFGSSELFERDDYGPDVMSGFAPMPKTPDGLNEVFNRAGNLLTESFRFARFLEVKTCIGTETPLTIPKEVKARLAGLGKSPDKSSSRELYEGIFTRLSKTCKPDYYWLWTPENWTWSGNTDSELNTTKADLTAAIEAAKNVKAEFTLATCGWVLGPQNDRAMFDNFLPKNMPMSCINRRVGMSPVDPSFGNIEERPKWAIPWLEDDPNLISPQLWAGRMRRDAVDAQKYGCTGLIGIHWRTKILSPNISALAKASWDHKNFKEKLLVNGFVEGNIADYGKIPIQGTSDPEIFRTARTDMMSFRMIVPKGIYDIKLGFCENQFDKKGQRIFNVDIQGLTVLERFDIFMRAGEKNKPVVVDFGNIRANDGFLVIDFHSRLDSPVISSIEIEGQGFSAKINCGGPAYKDFKADNEKAQPRDLDISDFYAIWATANFGTEASKEISDIFTEIDGTLPRPADWVNGPGGLKPDSRPWEEVVRDYIFASDFEELRQSVKGPGNIERFDYWMNNFNYMSLTAQLCCEWARFNTAMDIITAEKNPASRAVKAKEEALPKYMTMVKLSKEVMNTLLATVSTTGELGTVANWNQHIFPVLLEDTGKKLSEVMREPLPEDAIPSKKYTGETKLIVPSARPSLLEGEPLRVKAIVLSQSKPQKVELLWRALGDGEFSATAFKNIGRGVYSVEVNGDKIDDRGTEYYVMATEDSGKELFYPATAPLVNISAVRMPWK